MPHRESFAKLRARYRAGQLNPLDVAESAVAHALEVDGQLNAFALLDRERAMMAARASAQRWQQGSPRSPIDGMPLTVKEAMAVAGWPTRYGSLTMPDDPATRSAEFVRRLEQAGAVLIGKTRAPEFNWKGVTDSPGFGVTRNPWNPSWTPGGSSGGCAAAVAAGVVRVSIGSDAGGSVRIPAAFTGILGLKPTFGRIPVVPYPSHFSQLAHYGPLAASVADMADVLAVITGPATGDWTSLAGNARPWAPPEAFDQRWRIGVLAPDHWEAAHAVVRAGMEQFVGLVAQAGLMVAEVDIDLAPAVAAASMLYRIGCHVATSSIDPVRRALLDPGLVDFMRDVETLTLRDYMDLMRARDVFASQMAALFEQYDLFVLPTLPVLPFEAGREVPYGWSGPDWMSWNPYTPAFNLSQHPALSYPVWPEHAPAPAGIQIVAAPGREDRLLGLASWLEERLTIRLATLPHT